MVNKFIPDTKLEALEYLSQRSCYIVAGGSDLMVVKKNTAGLEPNFDRDVVFVANIPELKKIYEDDLGVHIGAAVTLYEIENSPLCPELLRQALHEVASVNIRHFATLAGNIANASPAGDTIVVDVALDALIKLEAKKGDRLVKAENFVLGVRKIDRHDDELITEIIFPKSDFTSNSWIKVGSRKADSISKISVACAYKIENHKVQKFTLSFGSVSAVAVRVHGIESRIIGLTIEELKKQKDDIVDRYSNAISPIDDQRSTRLYRLTVARNILNNLIDEMCKGDSEE